MPGRHLRPGFYRTGERANQLMRLHTTCCYLGWKNCYSSCVRVWNTSAREAKCEKLPPHLPRWSAWGLRTQTLRDCPLCYVELTSTGQGPFWVGIFFCFKTVEVFRAVEYTHEPGSGKLKNNQLIPFSEFQICWSAFEIFFFGLCKSIKREEFASQIIPLTAKWN